MKRIPNLSLTQVYPPTASTLNTNTCHDPDCDKFGVAPEFGIRHVLGSSVGHGDWAEEPNLQAVGLGGQKLDGRASREYRRIISTFEYAGDPHIWLDR